MDAHLRWRLYTSNQPHNTALTWIREVDKRRDIRMKYEMNTRRIRDEYEMNTRDIRDKYENHTGNIREEYVLDTGLDTMHRRSTYEENTWNRRKADGTRNRERERRDMRHTRAYDMLWRCACLTTHPKLGVYFYCPCSIVVDLFGFRELASNRWVQVDGVSVTHVEEDHISHILHFRCDDWAFPLPLLGSLLGSGRCWCHLCLWLWPC